MAYKTSHRLILMKFDNPEDIVTIKEIKEVENYIEGNDDISWVISEGIAEWGESDRSFTNKYKNMKQISEKFPGLLFILDYDPIDDFRIGECREYWFNGKVQKEHAEISIAAFDVNKLL